MTAGAFFRLCRLLHGYLSAFAFLALMFFSATGLLLNHPDWLSREPAQRTAETVISKTALAQALAGPRPAEAVARVVGRAAPLTGPFKSGDVQGDEVFFETQGVRGSSSVLVDARTGAADITTKPSSLVTVLNDLHRGKGVGPTWSLVIDLSAVLILALSILGYVLFFSLRLRLRTSLLLTAASLAAMAAIFVFLTP